MGKKWNVMTNLQGMDKILWGMGNGSGTVEVTNDGATILRSVGVDNPAAKVPDWSRHILNYPVTSCNILLFISTE